jgi:hypothetical protein
MQDLLKYAIDAEASKTADDLRGWWIPFACLGLTIGGICLLALICTTALSYLFYASM